MIEVTAPGKVLVLGGYAVLEGFPALSVAMVDRKWHGADAIAESAHSHKIISKGFGLEAEADVRRLFSSISDAPREHKVAIAAHSAALAYLEAGGHKPKHLRVELKNSHIFGESGEKSGLGSSAASTVALIAALFEGNGLPIGEHRDVIHKIAQVSHSLATERVGSGFDIATSVYGSIRYNRFDSAFLAKALGGADDRNFGSLLRDLASKPWPGLETVLSPVEGFSILLFNIKGGKTSTVSSVKAMRRLSEYVPELYQTLIRSQAEWEAVVAEGLKNKEPSLIREGMRKARAAQRDMTAWIGRVGMLSFDPIEPPQLTRLIDEAEKLEGVVAGRCPGSGGFDSVVFIGKGNEAENARKIIAEAKGLGLRLEHIDAVPASAGVGRTDKEIV
jgi:ERG8-type phosphomevalonate kinase